MSPVSPAPGAARAPRVVQRMSRDDGFGMIEAVVALVIIFGLILVLMRTFDSSSRVLVETRRQSAANALALELIERAQALEWENMGLAVSTNGATCPAQVGCYAAEFPTLAATAGGYSWGAPAEDIVFSTGETFRPFLDFHERLDRDGTDFDRYIFITSVDDDGDGFEDFRRLTALVRWTPPGGFRREVVQTTIVAPFIEPAQPLIQTDVAWTGGTVDIHARTEDLLYLGKDLASTVDDVAIPRGGYSGAVIPGNDQFELAVTFPRLEVNSVSDYVSSASTRAESAAASKLRFAGPDGVFGTADDPVVFSTNPATFSQVADDDNISGAPTALGPSPWTGDSVLYRGPGNLTIADIASGWTLYTIDGVNQNPTVGGSSLVDVVHDDNPAVNPDEDLPWAEGSYVGAGHTVIGTRMDLDVQDRFAFYLRSGLLEVGALADRDDSSLTGDRDTFGSVGFLATGVYSILDDSVMQNHDGDFRGWVVVDPPSGQSSGVKAPLNIRGVGAGETGAFPTTVSSTDPALRVYLWNADTGKYDLLSSLSFTSPPPGCDTPVATSPGNVQQVVVNYPGTTYDRLRYTVRIALDVRGFCRTTTADSLGNVAETVWQTGGPMVTGEVDYVVEGTSDGITFDPLFDFTLAFSTDQFVISSVYIDPAAN